MTVCNELSGPHHDIKTDFSAESGSGNSYRIAKKKTAPKDGLFHTSLKLELVDPGYWE